MPYSIHGDSLNAKKARILLRALIDCAKAGTRLCFATKKMLWGLSLYLECGSFTRENWRTYHRVSEAAKKIRDSGDKEWKKKLTFEHVRPISKMYEIMLEERAALTLDRAASIIGDYPPILVTVEEERRMTERGFKHGGRPEQRYAHIPLKGFTLRSERAVQKDPDPAPELVEGPEAG